MRPECPLWFIEAFDEHVAIGLALNWNKTPPDYSEAAKKLWLEVQRKQFSSPGMICPEGQKLGAGHTLAWIENGTYGDPNVGGLYRCRDCGNKLYTRMNGDFVPVEI